MVSYFFETYLVSASNSSGLFVCGEGDPSLLLCMSVNCWMMLCTRPVPLLTCSANCKKQPSMNYHCKLTVTSPKSKFKYLHNSYLSADIIYLSLATNKYHLEHQRRIKTTYSILNEIIHIRHDFIVHNEWHGLTKSANL